MMQHGQPIIKICFW